MSWWQLVPALLCTAAIVFLPGYMVVRSWAFTGLVAVGMAAPISIGLLASMAVLGPMVGLSWNVLLVVVPAVVLALVGLVLRRAAPQALGIQQRRSSRPLLSRWPVLVHLGALLIPAALLTHGLTGLIGSPENISQTYDNIFHLNAVRYVLDSGSGSSLTLGGLHSNGANPSSYPAAWHDLVSLVVQVSGVSIAAAVNAVTLVIGALVWPISCIFLATRAAGTRPVPMLFAGALSAVFGAFPYLMLTFGVLYPFFLSLALLPAALALLTVATGLSKHHNTPPWVTVLMLVLTIAGVGLAHPSTALALAIFAVPIFVVAIVRYRRTLPAHRTTAVRTWTPIVLLIGYLAAGAMVWKRVRPTEEASQWEPIQSESQAIGQVLSAGPMQLGPTWIVLLLTLVAFGLALQRQLNTWVLGIYLVAAGLFFVVSATPKSALRNFLTGVWYNDSYRLAGQLPVVTVVFCTIPAVWLFVRTQNVLSSRFARLSWLQPTSTTTPAVTGFAIIAAIALGVVGQYSSVNHILGNNKFAYRFAEQSEVLSPAEKNLLERIDEHVPPEHTIIGNPWSGTSLSYAISGRRTLTPHAGGTIPPDTLYLMNNLDEIDTNPRVCATIQQLDSHYVLDFGDRQVHDKGEYYDGLESPAMNPGLTEIDREGDDAVLYQVTGCPFHD